MNQPLPWPPWPSMFDCSFKAKPLMDSKLLTKWGVEHPVKLDQPRSGICRRRIVWARRPRGGLALPSTLGSRSPTCDRPPGRIFYSYSSSHYVVSPSLDTKSKHPLSKNIISSIYFYHYQWGWIEFQMWKKRRTLMIKSLLRHETRDNAWGSEPG